MIHSNVQMTARYLHKITTFFCAILFLAACNNGQPSNTGGSSKTDTYTFNLARQQVYQGPIPYASIFGGRPLPIYGNLIQIRNPNAFRIGLLLAGHNSSECFSNPNAVLVLSSGSKTTPENMKSIYGQTTPSLPVTIAACVESGATVLDSLPVTLTYTHEP